MTHLSTEVNPASGFDLVSCVETMGRIEGTQAAFLSYLYNTQN